jgi:hypothetical protein
MSGPYFQKQSWPAFIYQGQTDEFTHFDEYEVEVVDSQQTARRIAISFSDHCFTREPEPGDDPALLYPHGTRANGHFCIKRDFSKPVPFLKKRLRRPTRFRLVFPIRRRHEVGSDLRRRSTTGCTLR